MYRSPRFLNAVRSFESQLGYLKRNPAITPTQLKWKQLINSMIGSTRSRNRAIDAIPPQQVLDVLSILSDHPEMPRRHEFFAAASSRLLGNLTNRENVNMSDSLRLLEVLLPSGLDVIDGESKRFRGSQVGECIQAAHELINILVEGISGELSGEDTTRFLICLALADSKGWIDSARCSTDVQCLLPKSIQYLSSGRAGHVRTCETLWAVGRLAESGSIRLDDADKRIMRRLISETDLLPFRSPLGFSNIEPAEPSTFHTLLQLDEAFPKLGLSDSSLVRSTQAILLDLSSTLGDHTVPIDLIWWSARAECGIHPLLLHWVSLCMGRIDRMTQRERWICKNGVAHIVEISKRKNGSDWTSLSEASKLKLRFFIHKSSEKYS